MKKKRAFPLILFLLPILGVAQPQKTPASKPLVFTHVTVIDATGAAAKPDMTLVIKGSRIAAVGKTGKVRVPKGSRVINARGKFVIPGLWDMHTHHQASGEESLPLFIVNGVTGTRDMGSDLWFISDLRRKITTGIALGPRIIAAGPMLDNAPSSWPFRVKVTNESEAIKTVRFLKSKGIDFIKVHARLPREAYFAVANEAKKQGMTFVGHVPSGVSLAEAAQAGQKSIEHLSEYGLLFECSSKPGVPLGQVVDTYSSEKCRALFDVFKQAGTWHTPTLTAIQLFSKEPVEIEEELRTKGYLRYAGPSLTKFWIESGKLTPPPPDDVRRELSLMAKKSIEIVGEMSRHGVRILAGCDALTPGFCLHDELEFMVKAGLSPMEALQTATRDPAEFVGELEMRGTVAPNKFADLVLLGGNPLEDIRNTRKIFGVVFNGKYFTESELQRMLAEVAATASKTRT